VYATVGLTPAAGPRHTESGSIPFLRSFCFARTARWESFHSEAGSVRRISVAVEFFLFFYFLHFIQSLILRLSYRCCTLFLLAAAGDKKGDFGVARGASE
jgi:hypothetical protein